MLKQFVLFDGESGVNYVNWFAALETNGQVNSQLITAFLVSLIHFTEDVFHGRLQNLEIEGGKLVLTGRDMLLKGKNRLILIGALVDQNDDNNLVNRIIIDIISILEKYLVSSQDAMIDSKVIDTEIRKYLLTKERVISIKDKAIYGTIISLVHISISMLSAIDYHDKLHPLLQDFLRIILPIVVALTLQSIIMERLGGYIWGKRTISVAGTISTLMAFFLIEEYFGPESYYFTGYGTDLIYFLFSVVLFVIPAYVSGIRVSKKYFIHDIKLLPF